MKITIAIEVDTPAEAKTIIDRMSRNYQTWVDLRNDPPEASTNTSKHLESQLAKIEPKERENVSPGEPTISKIGTNTKDWIIGQLTVSRSPEHFGTKFEEHLKLLWKRGEVKFDGKEYYL